MENWSLRMIEQEIEDLEDMISKHVCFDKRWKEEIKNSLTEVRILDIKNRIRILKVLYQNKLSK